MSVSETFDRKFNKSMRGYNTEEVDAAIDALLRYCDELEDANREFEIANNDLIDAKTELNKNIAELTADNENLEKQISEMSEKLCKVEEVYNGYRKKFGEARDLITGAKESANEIISRANLKADRIIKDAEAEGEKLLSDLDKEIRDRKKLIAELDVVYNKFSEKIKTELKAMLARVDNFNVMPIVKSISSEAVFSEDSLPISESSIPPIEEIDFSANDSEQSNKADGKSEIKANEEKPKIPQKNEESDFELNFEPVKILDDEKQQNITSSIFYSDQIMAEKASIDRSEDVKFTHQTSRLSQIKTSIEDINRKVLEKKSTPHI